MNSKSKIITVGLCPSWDTVCRVDGVDWGGHKQVSLRSDRPAGKALNVSQALAWMGQKSTAAGLWGRNDFERMLKAVRPLKGQVLVKMTAADGGTRQNITVVDTADNREMHLRNKSELASKKALRKLKADLQGIVTRNSVCVFAGSMPDDELLLQAILLMKLCTAKGAKVVVDTGGEPLKKIIAGAPQTQKGHPKRERVRSGTPKNAFGDPAVRPWLISPNVNELKELVGAEICDRAADLAKAGRGLLGRIEIVLISRGRKGAIVVTKQGCRQGRCVGRRKSISTVGCGDFLLAGFLKGLKETGDVKIALQTAIQAATAKAWGWSEVLTWPQVQRRIKVESKPLLSTFE